MLTLLMFRLIYRLVNNCCIWINERHLIEAKVGEFRDPILKLLLNIQSELCQLTHWRIRVLVSLLEIFVSIFFQVEFYRVVTSSNCLHIEVHKHVLFNCTDVIEINDRKAVD